MVNPYESPGLQLRTEDPFVGVEFPVREQSKLTPAVFAAASTLQSKKYSSVLRISAAVVGLVSLSVATGFIALGITSGSLTWGIMFVASIFGVPSILLLIWVVCLEQISSWLMRRRFENDPKFNSKIRYEFDRRGVTVRSDETVSEFAWSEFQHWRVGDGIVLGFFTTTRYVIFRVEDFSPIGRDIIRGVQHASES